MSASLTQAILYIGEGGKVSSYSDNTQIMELFSTCRLTLNATPVISTDGVNKAYVDSEAVSNIEILGSGTGTTGVQNAVFNIGSFTTTGDLGKDNISVGIQFYRTAGVSIFIVGISNAINTSPKIYGVNTYNLNNMCRFSSAVDGGLCKSLSNNSLLGRVQFLDYVAGTATSQNYTAADFAVNATEIYYINLDASAGNCTLSYSWIAWRTRVTAV